jgi:hypothetical protein
VSSSDRLLVPACTCGKKLTLWAPDTLPSQDVTHVRIYRCGDCDHETRITVWGADVQEDLRTTKVPHYSLFS